MRKYKRMKGGEKNKNKKRKTLRTANKTEKKRTLKDQTDYKGK